MGDILREQPRQPEISNLNIETVVEEDVVGFDITVDDVRGVEIGQCACRFNGDFHSGRPR